MVTNNPYDAPSQASQSVEREQRRVTIRRVDPLSCARLLGALYALIGLFMGILFSLLSLFSVVPPGASGAPSVALLLGVGAVILLPLVYGLMGAVGGLILAFLYNTVASLTGGGIELDIE